MIVLALVASITALVVSATSLALVVMGARRAVEGESLPSSTFMLSADQREAMAPEVQARIFQEETLARIAKRR